MPDLTPWRIEMKEVTDLFLCVTSSDTARIQEAHILAEQIPCGWIETNKTTFSAQVPGITELRHGD